MCRVDMVNLDLVGSIGNGSDLCDVFTYNNRRDILRYFANSIYGEIIYHPTPDLNYLAALIRLIETGEFSMPIGTITVRIPNPLNNNP